jgi:histidinol-phosphate aminotransferase
LPLLPRKTVAALKECKHGGVNYSELHALGVDIETMLDFSVSTNPFMPPPGIKEIAASAHIECYPDSASTQLRLKLAEKLGTLPENIVCGSGTTELIRLIALAYFRRMDTVLIIDPTYSEYETACRFANARVLKYRTAEQQGFTLDIDPIAETIERKRPYALFLCNPNNPTGKYIPQRDIEKIMGALGDGLLILDEAYVPFVEKRWDSLHLVNKGNIILLRSMTKDYGIPGLRLGYALARPEIASVLRSAMLPWSVSSIAQDVGTALLHDDVYLQESLLKIREAARFLSGELLKRGFKVLPSDTNFFLVKLGCGAVWQRSLLQKGILVRDCSSFGLPEYIRLSARPIPDCLMLTAALDDILKNGENVIFRNAR